MVTPGAIKDVYICSVNENGEAMSIYTKLADVINVELPEEPEEMNLDNYKQFCSETKTLSFDCKFCADPRALYYFFTNGNDLYVRFPKKLRRKKGWERR